MSAAPSLRWPPEREDALRRLHADKKSMSQMANELGAGLTRNAVIGKCHRLGLSCADRPAPQRMTSAPSVRKPRVPPARKTPAPTALKRSAPPLFFGDYRDRDRGLPLFCRETACKAVAPAPLMIGLLDLGAAQCRYHARLSPRGVVELYCGHATGGGSWCPHHARLVYAPPKSRRAA